MTEIISAILAFIIAIGVLVSVHEYGHFWVARKLGFKVLRFSVGFGSPLLRWQGRKVKYPANSAETGGSASTIDSAGPEYWLSSIPLGGYVKLLDEREGPVPLAEQHLAFNRRPISHRIAVLFAGPGFNFLFAIFAYWLMFVSGVPGTKAIVGTVTAGSVAEQVGMMPNDEILTVGGRPAQTWDTAVLAILDELLRDGLIDITVQDDQGVSRDLELDVRGREAELTEPEALWVGLGFEPGPILPPVMDEISDGGAAEQAGFISGDEVISVEGEEISSWFGWVEYIRERPGETVMVVIERNGFQRSIELTIGFAQEGGQAIGRIGAGMDTNLAQEIYGQAIVEQRFGILDALPKGVIKTWDMSVLTVRMFARMFTGDVSVRNISGPLNIATIAGDSARAGFTAFLGFMAIVSISLGVLNLLPVPLLDGGQIVYQLVELVKGSPVSERSMLIGQQVGVFLLFILMSFAFYNDITRMFS
ncbi:MAG: RIP metalloprotease RseP [Gammaproteobacteria bacterium]|nr:RIP metalloprotease RseP [Gammaproteobacteria bacterium]